MGSKEAGTRTAAAMLLALAAAAPGGRAEAAGLPAARVVSLRFEPPSLTFLHRRDARHFLVIAVTPDGQTLDVTEKAAVRPLQGLVRMGEGGYLEPLKAGRGAMAVTAAGITARLPVTVRSLAAPSVSFVRDVMPALSKTGCNAGTCHGAARGRNGFRLSLRGYDPDWDYHALVDEVFGRRVNKAVPDQSLALLKPVQAVPHQGGLVFEPSSRFYRVIRQWIAEGLSSDVGSTARVSRLEVLPASPTLRLPGEKQNLVVVAHYPDGSTRDVTREAIYTSSVPEVAEVSDGAQVTAVRRGEAAMLVRYEGQYATGEVTVLGDRRGWKWLATPQHNQIDGLVDAKLRRIKSSPTGG